MLSFIDTSTVQSAEYTGTQEWRSDNAVGLIHCFDFRIIGVVSATNPYLRTGIDA